MFAALTGAKLDSPEQHDGEDLSGIFSGKAPVRKKLMFWEYGRNDSYFYPRGRQRSPGIAVREGKWKLLVNEDGSRAELYDIDEDPMEKNNLYASNEELGERLKKLALDWRKSLPPRPEPETPVTRSELPDAIHHALGVAAI